MVGMRSSVSSHALQLRPAWKCSLAWPRRVPDSASWKSSEVIFFPRKIHICQVWHVSQKFASFEDLLTKRTQ